MFKDTLTRLRLLLSGKNLSRPLENLLLWVSCTDIEVLERTERQEREEDESFASTIDPPTSKKELPSNPTSNSRFRQRLLGWAVLLSGFLAFDSAFLFAQSFTDELYVAIFAGLLYSGLIVTIERFIISAVKPDPVVVVSRLFVSLLVGLLIALPLSVTMFEGVLDQFATQEQQGNIEQVRTEAFQELGLPADQKRMRRLDVKVDSLRQLKSAAFVNARKEMAGIGDRAIGCGPKCEAWEDAAEAYGLQVEDLEYEQDELASEIEEKAKEVQARVEAATQRPPEDMIARLEQLFGYGWSNPFMFGFFGLLLLTFTALESLPTLLKYSMEATPYQANLVVQGDEQKGEAERRQAEQTHRKDRARVRNEASADAVNDSRDAFASCRAEVEKARAESERDIEIAQIEANAAVELKQIEAGKRVKLERTEVEMERALRNINQSEAQETSGSSNGSTGPFNKADGDAAKNQHTLSPAWRWNVSSSYSGDGAAGDAPPPEPPAPKPS